MTDQPVTEAPAWYITLFLYLGGGAIVFSFLLIMMVATAQQDVQTRLKAEGLSQGYSTALTLRDEAEAKTKLVPTLQRAVKALSSGLGNAQAKLDQEQREFDMAWDAFAPNVSRLNHAGLCDLGQTADTPGQRAAIANDVRDCQLDPAAPAASTRTLAAAQSQAQHFEAAASSFFQAFQDLDNAKRALADKLAELKDSQTLTPDQEKAQRSFGDIGVMLQKWTLFGGSLVKFPPALLQILLTFASGLFGALLVTLILEVYPSSEISSEKRARPIARTILGGCIALCVYVVILSGTAVIGAGGSSSGAGTNYMAFCGIGVLAGMFADRVAGWLSDRANQMFKPEPNHSSPNDQKPATT